MRSISFYVYVRSMYILVGITETAVFKPYVSRVPSYQYTTSLLEANSQMDCWKRKRGHIELKDIIKIDNFSQKHYLRIFSTSTTVRYCKTWASVSITDQKTFERYLMEYRTALNKTAALRPGLVSSEEWKACLLVHYCTSDNLLSKFYSVSQLLQSCIYWRVPVLNSSIFEPEFHLSEWHVAYLQCDGSVLHHFQSLEVCVKFLNIFQRFFAAEFTAVSISPKFNVLFSNDHGMMKHKNIKWGNISGLGWICFWSCIFDVFVWSCMHLNYIRGPPNSTVES